MGSLLHPFLRPTPPPPLALTYRRCRCRCAFLILLQMSYMLTSTKTKAWHAAPTPSAPSPAFPSQTRSPHLINQRSNHHPITRKSLLNHYQISPESGTRRRASQAPAETFSSSWARSWMRRTCSSRCRSMGRTQGACFGRRRRWNSPCHSSRHPTRSPALVVIAARHLPLCQL